MKSKVFAAVIVALTISFLGTSYGVRNEGSMPRTPLDMEYLKKALTYARGIPTVQDTWPKTVRYVHKEYNFKNDTFIEKEKVFVLAQRPSRIVAHSAGVAEILWAICPHERIVGFNEFAADPKSCFIADLVKNRGPIFKSYQTELVLGYRPDLVLTVFYSSAEFKEKLKQAGIPFFDLGYFGTLDSIKDQILLTGRIIGEEANARELVRVMDEKTQEIKSRIPKRARPLRILYYDLNGYVPGQQSNFTSICEIIGAVNVGAEQGVKSWSQIDYETLLKWDPDAIVVPEGTGLDGMLMKHSLISHSRAVRNTTVLPIPVLYLQTQSQYILLSANALAGIVYARSDEPSQ